MKPKDNPTEFVLELVEDKQQVAVTKEKPFSQVAGYLADLRYEPEKLSFIAKRVGDSLVFAGDTNKIVAITETNVTVRATSNDKRTTIPYKPAQ
jgi:predicted RNA methylase